jgi:hypothetical protein
MIQRLVIIDVRSFEWFESCAYDAPWRSLQPEKKA